MKTAYTISIIGIIVTIACFILTHFGNPWSKAAISPEIIVIKKDISRHACACSQTTCSMCLMSLHTGNDLGNPDPSVLSPREQPVQTHSESGNVIQQRAKQIELWYDNTIWPQQIVNQQIANR